MINNIYGLFLQQSDRCIISECRSYNNTDNAVLPLLPTEEGFTDIGTPAFPGTGTSFFEANRIERTREQEIAITTRQSFLSQTPKTALWKAKRLPGDELYLTHLKHLSVSIVKSSF